MASGMWKMTMAVCTVLGMSSVDSTAQTLTRVAARQDVPLSRSGEIPGLGAVTAAVAWDGRQTFVLAGGEFELTRTFDPATRETRVRVGGSGESPLTIALGGAAGFSISRSGRVVRGTSDADAIRSLLGGRAVAAARERLGGFERRLLSGAMKRLDDPHAYGFLLVGALLSSLAGDPAALGRARDLIVRRAQGDALAVRFEFKNCVTEYEKYLLKIDSDRTLCLQAANSRDDWYERAADRLGCEMEFVIAALAGEGQFVSCTALGSIV